MNNPKQVFLDSAAWLEFSPVVWRPTTGDERLAALTAYMTGDGTIAKRSAKYSKRDGSTSIYKPTMTGAFYSNVRADLEEIATDCEMLGIAVDCAIGVKKTLPKSRDDGFQFQLCDSDCREMVDAGVPVGKKTTQEFDVPQWVLSGEPGVKRAYLAALFGAEGSTPTKDRGSKSRLLRPIVLTMCKIEPTTANQYFANLQKMLLELGIKASVTVTRAVKFEKPYATYALRISGLENLIAFCELVGYVYCDAKAIAAWKWLQYMKAYRVEVHRRRDTALRLRSEGESYEIIGAAIGLTKGAAYRLLADIDAGRATTAGQKFPHYDEWMRVRWIDELGLLRLRVASCTPRSEPTEVWNMLVSSPDHSYVLASGANNFNSFETMSGRVYYPFDRSLHTGEFAFNPKLPIWVGMDFNIDPMSAVIFQQQPDTGEIWAVDEVVLFGSNTEEMCDELEKRYWRYQDRITVYPDPAGGQRQHARGETDIDILREKGFARVKYRRKHPAVADRVNAVNRMLRSANGSVKLRVDNRCKHFINALEQTIYKPGTRDVDKAAGVEHSADAGGYCIELEFPVRKVKVLGVSL